MAAEGIHQDQDCYRTLTALARVSKAFSETALDALWRDLHSLLPLIMLLPQDAFQLDTGRSGAVRSLICELNLSSGLILKAPLDGHPSVNSIGL